MGSLSLNSQQLPRYDATKVAPTGTFLGNYLYREIPENIQLEIALCSTVRATETPILALHEFLGRFFDYLVTLRPGF